MNELDAMKSIDAALSALDDAAKARALLWANQKFGNGTVAPIVAQQSPHFPEQSTPPAKDKPAKAKAGKKSKTIIGHDKTMDLFPKGKVSAVDFAKEKSPSNVLQKGVVAIFYIRDVLGYEKVGIPQVAAFFKGAGWQMPSDLANTLQQAGTAGWLDTADSSDIKITSTGENLVQFTLPAKKSA